MSFMEDKYNEIKNDPKKRSRAFKVIWLVSYGMLVLGAFIIIWVLLSQ
jgi:predicted nucleic acid-binding Zn ribbon protein